DLYGHPTAVELLEAVREFLDTELRPTLDARLGFLTRVASGVVGTVERELRTGPEPERRHRERLAALGFSSDGELAAALQTRAGPSRGPGRSPIDGPPPTRATRQPAETACRHRGRSIATPGPGQVWPFAPEAHMPLTM